MNNRINLNSLLIEAKPFFVPKPFINPDKSLSFAGFKYGNNISPVPLNPEKLSVKSLFPDDNFDIRI